MERNKQDRIEQRTKCLRARQGQLPVKFLANATNEKPNWNATKTFYSLGIGTKSLKIK